MSRSPRRPRTSARSRACPPCELGVEDEHAVLDAVVGALLLAHAVDEHGVRRRGRRAAGAHGRRPSPGIMPRCRSSRAAWVAAHDRRRGTPASVERRHGRRRVPHPPLPARAPRARDRRRGRQRHRHAAAQGARAGRERGRAASSRRGSRAAAGCSRARRRRSRGRPARCPTSARRWRSSRSPGARACTGAATCCSCPAGDPRAALERFYRRAARAEIGAAARCRDRPRGHPLHGPDDPRPAHALGVVLVRGRDVVQLAACCSRPRRSSTTSSSTRSATSR